MDINNQKYFQDFFDDLEDPRVDRTMNIRRLSKKAGWDDATLDLILQANFQMGHP